VFVVRMYSLARPLAEERAPEPLELFEMTNDRRKLIAEYSKGLRKRIAAGARLMKDILLDQVRQGATLEEVFVCVVGSGREYDKLEWLT
jgi:ABC-2 type transport system ATP-binding protein